MPQEEYFPRNWKKTKRINPDAADELDNDAPRPKKPDKRTVGKNERFTADDEPTEIELDYDVIERLKPTSLQEGMLLLGCVSRVNQYNLLVNVAGGLFGSVPVTNISDEYLDLLRQYSENPSGAEIHVLEDMFTKGFYVVVKLVELEEEGEGADGRRKLVFTLNPKEVNGHLNGRYLKAGDVIQASVKSVEDHGYVMNLGVLNATAFLPKKNSVKSTFKTGQIVACSVKEVKSESTNKSIVILSADRKAFNVDLESVRKSKDLNAAGLMPGSVVTTKIVKASRLGLIGKCGNVICHVTREQTRDQKRSQLTEMKLQLVTGRVLYQHPVTKIVYLSLNDSLLHWKPPSCAERAKQGHVYYNAKVTAVEPSHAYVKLDNKLFGICAARRLSDKPVRDVTKEFGETDSLNCRVIAHWPLDNLVVVSAKKEDLEEQFRDITELKVGAIVKGTVDNIDKGNIFVKLSSTLKGLVPSLHTADRPLTNPSKKYTPGNEIECRVVSVDLEKRQVSLTLKHTLITSTKPILTEYSESIGSSVYQGVVVNITERGLLVVFFNGVKGFVPKKETMADTELTKAFYLGQVVVCKVLLCEPEKQLMHLTLNLSTANDTQTTAGKLVIGEVVSCTVTAIQSSKLLVTVTKMNRKKKKIKCKAEIPFNLLADLPCQWQMASRSLKVGDIIKSAVVFFFKLESDCYWLTTKRHFLEFAAQGKLVTKKAEIKVGVVSPAVVCAVKDGLKLQLAGGLRGYVPHKLIDDTGAHDMKIGQTVLTQITSVKKSKIVMATCFKKIGFDHRDAGPGLDLLENVLELKANLPLARKVTIGMVVQFKVTETNDIGLLGAVDDDKAYVTLSNLGDVAAGVGDCIEAVVVDVLSDCMEVTARSDLVKAAKNRKENKSSCVKPGQSIKGEVIGFSDDYCLVVLRAHGAGKFAFLPARVHVNDTVGRKDLFGMGQVYPLTVMRVVGEHILAILKPHEVLDAKFKRKKDRLQKENVSVKLGQVLTAKIAEIKTFSVVLAIKKSKLAATVHITEVLDRVKVGESPVLGFKVGQEVQARVIRIMEKRRMNSKKAEIESKKTYFCSMKDSVVNSGKSGWKVLTSSARIKNVKTGDKLNCVVKSVFDDSVSVFVSSRVVKDIGLVDLSDSADLLNVRRQFKVGQALVANAVCREQGLALTLLRTRKFARGDDVWATVLSFRPDTGFTLQLPFGYKGTICLTDVTDNYDDVDDFISKLTPRTLIKTTVLATSDADTKCSLSIRPSRLKTQGDSIYDKEIDDAKTLTPGAKIRGFVISIDGSAVTVQLGTNLTGSAVAVNAANFKMGRVVSAVVKSGKKGKFTLELVARKRKRDGSLCESVEGEGERDRDKPDIETVPSLIDVGFEWGGAEEKSTSRVVVNEDEVVHRPKKKVRMTEMEEEESLYIREHALQGENREIKSIDDYENLVVTSPNSSLVWIQYMIHHIQNGEADRARAVGTRALKTISFREEEEKLNVWTALLNMENTYGTDQTLEDTFLQATQQNDPLKVHLLMVRIYCRSDKDEKAEELLQRMVKKFRGHQDVWLEAGQFYIRTGNAEKSREIMQRALGFFPEKNHIDIISKFAQFEFRFGDAEKGKTMFESLLNSYPKRIDQWSVYIDAVIKTGNSVAARELFEKVSGVDLGAKKMKSVFKKWLDFEQRHGDEYTAERVKQKAVDYVHSTTVQ